MNCTLDEIFQDDNGLWVVTYRGDHDYVRLRMTTWQSWQFWAGIKLRKMLGLPILPYHPPAGTIYETGPRVV